jgi:anti-sigma regulatory factor (Ser/Thr protein kinase)
MPNHNLPQLDQSPLHALLDATPDATFSLDGCNHDNPDSLANIRADVGKYLTDTLRLASDDVEAIQLVTSETAGNVIAHSDGRLTRLDIHRIAGAIAVSVGETGDTTTEIPGHIELPDTDAESGRGLFLIDILTAAHGSRRAKHGADIETDEGRTATEHWFLVKTIA